MKRDYLIVLILFFTTFTLAANNYRGSLVFKNPELTKNEDVLFLSFDLELNKNTVNSAQSLFIFPQLKSEVGSETFPYIQITGPNRNKVLNRSIVLNKKQKFITPYIEKQVDKNTQETLHYSIEVPYEDWMKGAELFLLEEMLGCAEEKRLYTYRVGAILEVKPEIYIPQPIYTPPAHHEKERKAEGRAFLDFKVGQSVILPDFRRNPEELAKIRQMIQETSNDPDITVNGIFIEGFASPEGSNTLNQRLSMERASALKNYIQLNSNFNPSLFQVSTAGEDWIGLKKLVMESSMADKERVLSIIDNYEEVDRKEQQLKALGAPYKFMLDNLFPSLRRVEYRINYIVRDYSVKESDELLSTDPSRLSPYELFLLAQNYGQDTDKWNEIILLTVNLYPDDPAAINNAAALYLNREEYDMAKSYLDKIKHLPEAQHNWNEYEKSTSRNDNQ